MSQTKFLRFIRNNIHLIPPFQIILTYLVYVFPDTPWVLVGNLFGYSIFTSIGFVAFFCFSKRYCMFTKVSSLGLLVISTFNTFSYLLVKNQEDYQTYEVNFSKLIVLIVIILSILLTIPKCKQRLRLQ